MTADEIANFIKRLEAAENANEEEITKLQEVERTERVDEEIDGLEALSMCYNDAISQLETLAQMIG